MDPMAMLIAFFVFGAVVFALLGFSASGQSSGAVAARQRLEGFKRGATAVEAKHENLTFGQRVVGPLVHGAAESFGSLLHPCPSKRLTSGLTSR